MISSESAIANAIDQISKNGSEVSAYQISN